VQVPTSARTSGDVKPIDEQPKRMYQATYSTGQYENWEDDPRFSFHKQIRYGAAIGMQPRKDLKVGPHRRGRIFVGPREDPFSFCINVLLVGLTAYYISTLSWGEGWHVRRKRIIKERLMKEYGLTEADLDDIEGSDAPLSDELTGSSASSSS